MQSPAKKSENDLNSRKTWELRKPSTESLDKLVIIMKRFILLLYW